MRKFFLLTSFFLFGMSIADITQTEFNELKSEVQEELVAIQSGLVDIVADCRDTQNAMTDELHYWASLAAQDPEHNNRAYSAASSMYSIAQGVVDSVPRSVDTLVQRVSYAQSVLSELVWPSSFTNIDLTPIVQNIISNRLQSIENSQFLVDSLGLVISNGSEFVSSTVSNSCVHLSSLMDTMLLNVQTSQGILNDILSAIQSLDVGGGGYDSQFELDYDYFGTRLGNLLTALIGVRTDLQGLRNDLSSFLSWAMNSEMAFQKFYSLAVERLQYPDASLYSDLGAMWQRTLYNMTNIVYRPASFTVGDQLFDVSIGPNGAKLSNEGYINLQQLAFQQRQYLCSVEMLNQLHGLNTTNNLSWITNYLYTVQKPYYELWNKKTKFNVFTGNLYFSGHLSPYTNFLAVASNPRSTLNQIANAWRSNFDGNTNFWDRLELYFLSLNGCIPTGVSLSTQAFQEENDEENTERRLRYATNGIAQVQHDLSSVSNNLMSVVTKFKELISAFDVPQNSGGYFLILPETTVGNFTIDQLTLPWNDLTDFTEPCRNVFTFVWYAIFSVVSFKMILTTCYLLFKTVNHIVLIVSTLMQ